MPASGPVGEDRRVALINRLCEVLGKEEARTLMESLPPIYWDQLATKDDIRATKDDIRATNNEIKATNNEIKASEERLRTEMNGQFALVQAQFAQVQAQFTALTAEMRGEFANVRGEFALQFARQTRTMVFTLAGFAVTIWGTILAVGLS